MMRITPLVVWCSKMDDEETKKILKADTEFVHPDAIVQECIFIYGSSLKYLLNNAEKKSMSERAMGAF